MSDDLIKRLRDKNDAGFITRQEAADRIEQVERERDEQEAKIDALTSGDWSKARLVRFENGQFDFSGGPVAFIAEYLAQCMESAGGYHNNMEVRVDHPKAGPMFMTLQRIHGKTPAQQRNEAEAKLTKAVDALRFYAEGEWPEDYPGGVLHDVDGVTHIDYGHRATTTLAELEGK